jgi:hypothetical protein
LLAACDEIRQIIFLQQQSLLEVSAAAKQSGTSKNSPLSKSLAASQEKDVLVSELSLHQKRSILQHGLALSTSGEQQECGLKELGFGVMADAVVEAEFCVVGRKAFGVPPRYGHPL